MPMSQPLPPLPDTFDADLGLDLHMHSTASDGALSPQALTDACHAKGVTRFSLTDHDTVAGVAEAQRHAESLGMRCLAGSELSTLWRGIGIHVVALLPEGASGALVPGLEAQAQARVSRAQEIARRLEKIGLEDALARAREQAGSERPLGRPDFAKALVAAGLVPDMPTAFKKYLGAGKPGDVKTHWPYLSEVVEWIRDSQGIAVLAHPLRYRLTHRKRSQLLDSFREAGGEAAELISGHQNADVGRDLARQLEARDLMGSQGSDFHYPGGPLAPGVMSAPPRCSVTPVWRHPKLARFAA
ncbi:phosphatase [Chromohalobacter japonicus]|uniref:Phosphatase n=2 Tax=Chromohalobacter japonicus TaxID=223900 RepID=A0A1Q8TBS9_9GAMM|nr:phosphatase [Chromohalobacter japonicus]